MTGTGLDMAQIVDLETQVATSTAVRATLQGDDLFELVISIVLLVYETNPG